jgi:hypothetical protein
VTQSSEPTGADLEASLVNLLARLEAGDFDADAQEAGRRAVEVIEAASPGSLTPEEQQRVKRLHALTLSQLESRRRSIDSELKRVQEARTLLRSCMRTQASSGGGVDIEG